jgi:hypothetical protein
LGDSLKNVILKNLIWTILSESKLGDLMDEEKLKEAA